MFLRLLIAALGGLGVISLLASGCASQSQSPSATSAPVAPASALSPTGKWSFESDPTGGLPAGAQAFTGSWAVRAEADSPTPQNALCQTGNADFPALMLDPTPYLDVVVVARFKPISGSTDRAAGLIFRIKNKDNYYIIRANALENNVNLYKYVDGRRLGLKDGQAKVASGQWQELRVEARGQTLRGFLNGQQVVEATDNTFNAAGGIGLWTKADSQTCFDEVDVSVPTA